MLIGLEYLHKEVVDVAAKDVLIVPAIDVECLNRDVVADKEDVLSVKGGNEVPP